MRLILLVRGHGLVLDTTKRHLWRNDMALPALTSRVSGARLINQLVLPDLVRRFMADTGPLAELSAAWSLPLYRPARLLAEKRILHRHPIWRNPAVDLAGLPVLVVGGLATDPEVLRPLWDWLHRIGCRTFLTPGHYGIACGQRAALAVERALIQHAEATGERVVIIAHSRGGQFARAVAVRRPDLVRGLITLGSPLVRLLGAHPIVLLKVFGLGVMGSLGIPGLMRASCLWGQCCRPLREDLIGPFPDDVPFLSIFSREDEVVHWQASLDPAARQEEVRTTHRGLIASPAAFQLLAQELILLADAPDHAKHVRHVRGLEHVRLGGDFDGTTEPDRPSRVPSLSSCIEVAVASSVTQRRVQL